MNKLLLYWNTLKYLKPVQIYGRIFSVLKKKFGLIKLPAAPNNLRPCLNSNTNFIFHEPWNSRDELIKGNFTFLNKTEVLSFPPRWNYNDTSLLWMFNLHYFNYLHLINKKEQLQICYDWIEKNEVGKGIAWHPYVISLRVISWCKIGFDDEKINRSIYQQASYLYRNLEYYHPANHYLENARALIFAGLYFRDQEEAGKWLKKGLEIYLKETPKQVLTDGGYFERSSMYHAIMLEGYLDIINIFPQENIYRSLFENTVKKMMSFLVSMTHPDGNISLFNDSTQEIASTTKELFAYASKLNIPHTNADSQSFNRPYIQSFNDSGYYVYRDNQIYISIDGGAVGPDFIPAHAHADIFSFELSVNGVQFIVDSGVYEYKSSDIRNYVRSTKAHNTLTIDRKDQAECWGGFRVARRYIPHDVSFVEKDDKVFFEGKFDGYSRLIGDDLNHQRKIEIDKSSSEFAVIDEVTGSGHHLVESFIHLHPDVRIEEGDNSLILSRNNISIKFLIFNFEFLIEDGWYCPEFGKRVKNKVIKIYINQLPCKLTYKLILK